MEAMAAFLRYIKQLINRNIKAMAPFLKYKGQGLAKSESIMGAILALSLNFQRMSYLCE